MMDCQRRALRRGRGSGQETVLTYLYSESLSTYNDSVRREEAGEAWRIQYGWDGCSESWVCKTLKTDERRQTDEIA
jgi:hypothetical protein